MRAPDLTRMGQSVRYGLALAGPILSAGAQFLLSLVLLRILDEGAFGRLSMLLIVTQFGWGVWTALFCAPMPILLNSGDTPARDRAERCLFAVDIACCLLAFVVVAAIARAMGDTAIAALLFGGYGAASLLRWFARAHAYATGHQVRSTLSDTIYALALLAGVSAMALLHRGSMEWAGGLLLFSAVAGMPAFGGRYLHAQFVAVRPAHARGYGAVWRDHARWSLLGVLTTEATANAHSYLVTLLRGATAFAPIAASSLMIRPITVAMNALTEFERARMARDLSAGRLSGATRAVRLFRLVLILCWLGTAAAVLVLLAYAPRLIFPPRYPFGFLVTGAVLWMLVGLVRLLRTPDSTLLQAGGAFRPLAMASVWSSGISVGAVLLLLAFTSPLWSIGGILVGEGVFALLVWRQAARWLAGRAMSAGSAAGPGNVIGNEEDPVLASEAADLSGDAQCPS